MENTEDQPVEITGIPGAARMEPVWFRRSDGTTYCSGDGIPESGQHEQIEAPVSTAKDEALKAIAMLEMEQSQRLTPRALRELYMGVMSMANQQTSPAFVALKSIDDRIRAERQKLA